MPDLPEAHSISVEHCDCGCNEFRIHLHNEEGDVFAVARLPPEVALGVSDQIFQALCPDIDDDDDIGPVAGNA